MRTNIVLDDDLVAEAMSLSMITTKREVVALALTEFVAFRKRLDVRALKGKGAIRADYNHKALRSGRR